MLKRVRSGYQGDANDVGVDDVDAAGGLGDEESAVDGFGRDGPPGHLTEESGPVGDSTRRHWGFGSEKDEDGGLLFNFNIETRILRLGP